MTRPWQATWWWAEIHVCLVLLWPLPARMVSRLWVARLRILAWSPRPSSTTSWSVSTYVQPTYYKLSSAFNKFMSLVPDNGQYFPSLVDDGAKPIKDNLGVSVSCVPTGVMHLHHEALKYDIGVQ